MNINDMEMMLRYSLGEKIITSEEIERIRLKNPGIVMAQLMIPLNCGTIGAIKGLNEILQNDYIIDFLQYYNIGEEVRPEVLGTLGQHFGRFTLQTSNKKEMIFAIKNIQEKLIITDLNGEDMYKMKFDVKRLSID